MPTTTRTAPEERTSSKADDRLFAETAAEESSRVMQKLREKTDAVVDRLQPQIEAVSDFARNDPTKAVLISAAVGAALMGLIGLMARTPSRAARARDTMTTIRDAAIDLADRAHSAAAGAIDTAHARARRAEGQLDDARERAGDAQKRAGELADTVRSSAADAWQTLRDQAAPYVERLRPQLDAVASYAKDDPARAAIGIATAGAVLLGLLSLIRHSDE